MSNYRPIYGKHLWGNEKFIELTSDEKVVFLYLLTCPSSETTGILKIRVKNVSTDTNLDVETTLNALFKLMLAGLIHYFDDTGFVYIPNYFKFAKGSIKNPSTLLNCINRQRELFQNEEVWKLFDEEYEDELLSIKKSLMKHQSNKNKDKDENDNKTRAKNKEGNKNN